jgi:hypothetical protein
MSKGTTTDERWKTKRRWREGDARRALDVWRGGGETLSAFARKNGLELQRVVRWRKRLAEEDARGGQEDPIKFIPAFLRQSGEVERSSDASGLLVIHLPNGTRIEVKGKREGGVSARWLSSLCRRLVEAEP